MYTAVRVIVICVRDLFLHTSLSVFMYKRACICTLIDVVSHIKLYILTLQLSLLSVRKSSVLFAWIATNPIMIKHIFISVFFRFRQHILKG